MFERFNKGVDIITMSTPLFYKDIFLFINSLNCSLAKNLFKFLSEIPVFEAISFIFKLALGFSSIKFSNLFISNLSL